MNKRYWLIVQIFMAFILMAVLLAGCGEKGVVSTSGMLTEITLAEGVDEDGRPLRPATVFATDADAFYCSFKVVDAPPGTEIRGKWIYVSGEAEEQIGGENFVMDEMPITIEGTRYAWVYYLRPSYLPDYRWPEGEYKVVLDVNGKEDASLPFTVKEMEAVPSKGDVSEVTMSTAVDEDDRPLNPTTVFADDTEKFYCSFKLSGVPVGSRMKLELVYVGGEEEDEIGQNSAIDMRTGTIERKGGGYTSTFFERPSYLPDYRWPKGDYKVVVYVDDWEKASANFKVE